MKKNVIIFTVCFLFAGIVFFGPRLLIQTGSPVSAKQPDLRSAEEPQPEPVSPSTALSGKNLTEPEIKQFLTASHQAMNSRDPYEVRDMYWDDAEISFLRSTKIIQIPLEGYIQKINEKWASVSDYTSVFRIENIELNDSKALVSGTVEESGKMGDGKSIRTIARSRNVLEKRNGRIKKIYEEIDLDKVKNEVID